MTRRGTRPVRTKGATVARWALGAGALLAATAVTGAARADEAAADRTRVQINLVGGAAMPSQFTPKIVYPTYTSVGPIGHLESTGRLLRFLELGAYLSLSSHPIHDQRAGGGSPNYDVSGSVLVASGGAVVKLRWDPAPWAALRFGATVGVNYDSFYLKGLSADNAAMPGEGLQVGLDVDFRLRVTDHFGLVMMVGMLSQPAGTAKFPKESDHPNKSVGFAFEPFAFVGAGPELMF